MKIIVILLALALTATSHKLAVLNNIGSAIPNNIGLL